jgi:hypothetical protein
MKLIGMKSLGTTLATSKNDDGGRQLFTKDDLIFSYSRTQAIEDGVLVNVTETAKEAGFKYPVAVTAAVWQKFVAVPPGVRGQDERGRLWDILWVLRLKMLRLKQLPASGCETYFDVLVRNDNTHARDVWLRSVCGPNDDGSPCITIMLPKED